MEFESNINYPEREPTRFVSDAERARRITPNFIDPDEIVASMGMFNALDGTTHDTEEAADAASRAYLGKDRTGQNS